MKRYIEGLLQYALKTKLMDPRDTIYTRNRLLELLELEGYDAAEVEPADCGLED